MLRLLGLRNFQIHRKLSLKLDPGVTTIIGPTDGGKSAIIRALRWLALSQPRGDSFISDGAETATVSLDAGRHKVRRSKGGKNVYRLDDQVFKAFGTKVPEDILSLLNLSDLNFQSQFDSPFWFSKSPGEISKQLNKIVDLSVIDTTLKKLGEMTRKTQTKEQLIEERLSKARMERKKLLPAKNAKADLQNLEKLELKLKFNTEGAACLRELLAKAVKCRNVSRRLREALSSSKNLLQLDTRLSGHKFKSDLLGSLISKHKNLESSTVQIPEPELLNRLEKKWNKVAWKLHNLETLLAYAETHLEDKRNAETVLKKHILEFHQEFQGKVCPLCDQKIPSSL